MTESQREIVRGWVKANGGDVERTAQWMARNMSKVGIRAARAWLAMVLA